MTRSVAKRTGRAFYRMVRAVVVVVLLWYAVAFVVGRGGGGVPYPHDVARQISASETTLLSSTWATVSAALVGLAIGTILGVLVGVAMAESPIVERAALPYLVAAQATPLVVLVPLLQTVEQSAQTTRIVLATFVSFFIVALTLARGLTVMRAGPERDLMRSYAAGRLAVLRRLSLPASLPFLFSALRIAAPLSVIGAVIADLFGATDGLGWVLVSSLTYGSITLLWAAAVITTVIAFLVIAALDALEGLVVPWQPALREARA